MKALRTFVIFIMSATIFFAGCKSKSGKELIIKKWKMIEISGGMANDMADSVKNKVLSNLKMEFLVDGKFILTGMDGTSHPGTYSLSDDIKTFTITPDATGKPETNTIYELSESRLIFTDQFNTRLVAVPD